jgi:nucleotide-binding universal stress UspA family protein
MKTILSPIDFSGITEHVVNEVITLARPLNARVILFSVVQPPIIMTEYAGLLDNIAEINAAGEANATRQLARFEAKVLAESIAVESSHATGAPIPLIVDQAEKCGADYIVMGSHGHTALYDLLVGSTTHGVLMRARCPVVIVPAAQSSKSMKPAKAPASVRL